MAAQELSYESDRYTEICRKLGADPAVHFVRVLIDDDRREVIDFTVGKPDEVRWLFHRAAQAGMPCSERMMGVLRA
jgi:hypothetical protein